MTARPYRGADGSELARKLVRILEDRERVYRRNAKGGHMTAEKALDEIAKLHLIAARFDFAERNAAWIKPEAERRNAAAKAQRELDEVEAEERRAKELAELAKHPAADAVLGAFPGAKISSVKPLTRPDASDVPYDPDATEAAA